MFISRSSYLSYTAVCSNTIYVNATIGCDNNQDSCQVMYRPTCDIPAINIKMDLTMSLALAFLILSSVFIESKVSEELDEAIQSTQDYSIVVNDPDPDAVDPDEWFDFFKQYGIVRYVTGIGKSSISYLQNRLLSSFSSTIVHAKKHRQDTVK